MSQPRATYTVQRDTTPPPVCWLPCPACKGNGCKVCDGTGYVDAKRVPDAKDTEHDLLWMTVGLD